jgi:hypothetical protein
MKIINNTVIALMSLFIVACASNDLATESQYSGFLDDYSQLEEFEMDNEGVGLIWVHPDVTSMGYTKAILEPTVIYPGPKHDSDEAKALIEEVTTYMDAALQGEVGKNIILTDNSGPNTVRVRFALTGVEISNENLATYEYVPVALLFVGAKTAAGARAQAVEIFFEAEMQDSISGEVLGRSVRKGRAESLKNKSEGQLDLWAEDAGNVANRVIGK